MRKTNDDVDALVRRFGGLTAMARALGHSHPSTVQGWQQRGAIPRWRIYEIRQSQMARRNPAVAEILDRLAPSPMAPVNADPHDPAGCRYIAGDPKGEWSYCNRAQRPGSPYCDDHHALCRVPADDAEALAEIDRAAAAAVPGWERVR